MRTTIEIDDELRAKLQQLAAERGEKGYSSLVNEALREYFEDKNLRQEKLGEVLQLEGTLSEQDVDELEGRIEDAWNSWEL